MWQIFQLVPQPVPSQSDQTQRHQESVYLLVSYAFCCGEHSERSKLPLHQGFFVFYRFPFPMLCSTVCRFRFLIIFCCFDKLLLDWVVTLKNSKPERSSFPHPLCSYLLSGGISFVSEDLGELAGPWLNQRLFALCVHSVLPAWASGFVWLIYPVLRSRPWYARSWVVLGWAVCPMAALHTGQPSLGTHAWLGDQMRGTRGPTRRVDRPTQDGRKLLCTWRSELVFSEKPFITHSTRICLTWVDVTVTYFTAFLLKED